MAQPDPPIVDSAADVSVRAFQVLRHLLHDDVDAANDVFQELAAQRGWFGVLVMVRAIAIATMDFSGLREKMALADPGDAEKMLDEHFVWAGPDGLYFTPEGTDRDLMIAGLRFMILAAAEARVYELRDDFHRQYHSSGDEAAMTVSGLLTVTMMAIRMLPQQLQDQLATFEPTTDTILAAARTHGVLPT